MDEQGTVRGLVTMEDLVEELVGEILSEGEVEGSGIQREADGSILVQGSTPIHELNRIPGLALPESEWAATIGGLAIERAGRIPVVGQTVQIDDWILEITEASHRRVKGVRLRPVGGFPPRA